MGDGDAQMGEDPAPAPLQPFGGGPSGDWGAEVEAEHEASGRNASVLEAEREKARARAERFNTEYKAPSAKTLAGANGLLSRKEVLAVRREQAEKKAARGGQFITGIDLFDPEEEAKRAARAAKFGAMLELTPEQKALREKAEAERQAREAGPKSAAPASAGEDAPVGDDAAMDAEAAPPPKADILEERVDPELDAVWRNDAVHLYGVDHMTTADCMGYFGEYGPVFCEWINDSSCNVVFADEHAARRAIRMKGQTMGAFANPDGKAALPEGLEAEMLWHSGPEFHTKGKTLRLSFRLATEDDIKPHGKIKSRYLWLGGKGGRGGGRGKRRRGDDNRDRGDGRTDAATDAATNAATAAATTRGREAQETERRHARLRRRRRRRLWRPSREAPEAQGGTRRGGRRRRRAYGGDARATRAWRAERRRARGGRRRRADALNDARLFY